MERYDSSSSSNGSPGPGGDHGNFGARVDHMGSTAQQLITEARSVVDDLSKSIDLKGRVERHPYGTLLAAVAVGYVVGGGLFTPLTARVVRLGMRLAALPFVKDELLGMAEAALNGATGRSGGGGGGSVGPVGSVGSGIGPMEGSQS